MRNKILLLLMGLSVVAAVAIANSPKQFTDKNRPTNAVTETPKVAEVLSLSTEQKPPVDQTPIEQKVVSETKKYYRVINVVDGDTVDVLMEGRKERIRLIGLDTPETVEVGKPVECFGLEASEKAKELLTDQEVDLEFDPTQGDRDRYNRLLRYIILFDGTNFAQKMIAEGYGREYTYESRYKYQNEFKETQKIAGAGGLGLWAEGVCPVSAGATIPTPTPTLIPTVIPPINTKVFNCDCKKTCGAMSSCEEAQYQLKTCGCKARDGNKDGVACDAECR